MPSKLQFSGKDFSNEETRFRVFFPDPTGATYDALIIAKDALLAACNGVVTHAYDGENWSAVFVKPGAKATGENSQREEKWRVKYVDATDPIGNGSFEVGMPDKSLLQSNGSDMDVSAGAGLAFVNAIEANCVSRLGNAITVQEVKYVGRNI